MGWYVVLHIWLAYPSTLLPNIVDFDDSQWITSVNMCMLRFPSH